MKKLLVIVCALSFFLVLMHAQEKKESLLDGITIVLDAGHGGKDQGTSCNEGTEASLNLSIVKKLQKQLNGYGANVVLTRDGDYDLASPNAHNRKKEDLNKRMEIISQNNANLFISIHANSFGSANVSGIQLFYQDGNEVSKKLCEMVHAQIKAINQNILKDKAGDYFVLNESKVPALLIECGFLSNEKDRQLLFQEAYQQKLADSISDAILHYFTFYY